MNPEQINLLLTMYYDPASSFTSMADALDISVTDLMDLLDHPDIRARIDRIDSAAESRLKSLEIHARIDCMTALAVHGTRPDAEGSTQRETARKAAAQIYRGRPAPRPVVHEPAAETVIPAAEPGATTPTELRTPLPQVSQSSSSCCSSSPKPCASPCPSTTTQRSGSSRSAATTTQQLAATCSSPP